VKSSLKFKVHSTRNARTLTRAIALFGVLSAASMSQSQVAPHPAWGTSDTSVPSSVNFETAAGTISAFRVINSAQFASSGVGLRNRSVGTVSISGVTTPAKAAYVYWAVLTLGAAKAANQKITVQRLFPLPVSSSATLAGTLVGTGPTPCWPNTDTISVFRGQISTTLATGNGLYKITLQPGASGSTAGEAPHTDDIPPLMEGASIVIVGTGSSNQLVSIYDKGLSGKTFGGNPGLTYSLALPSATTGAMTLFTSIGADGEHYERAGLDDESTIINNLAVAGPSSPYNDSDWNGTSGLPLAQLWDDVMHNITAATPAGTKVLNVSIANQGEAVWDCLSPVANIVQQR
jgi:hypothetical protein